MSEPIRRPGSRPPASLSRPALPLAPTVAGVEFVPRADAVLRVMSTTQDEREWQRMIDTDPAISSSIEQRASGLLQDGWEIVPGSSGSTRSEELAQFVTSAFSRRGLRLATVLREMLDSIFLGWRPVEVLWQNDDAGELSGAWVPTRLIAHDPWDFKFATDGRLVHSRSQLTGSAQSWDLETLEGQMRWILCQAGASRSPYGRSWLSRMWLLWFVRREFDKMTSKGIARALGVFKAIRKRSADRIGGAPITDASALTSELAKILQMLDSTSLLLETQDWSFEHLASPGDAVGNLEKISRYFDEVERIAIVGQTLSSSVGTVGSRAAAETHMRVLESYWRADGRQLVEWVGHLVRTLVDVNFGPQAPADYPAFSLCIFERPDLAATALYFNMGGRIDAQRLAHRARIPAVFDDRPDGEVLERQSGAQMVSPPGAAGAGQRRPAQRADAVSSGSPDVDELLASFEPDALGELYDDARQRILEAVPDPPSGLSE